MSDIPYKVLLGMRRGQEAVEKMLGIDESFYSGAYLGTEYVATVKVAEEISGDENQVYVERLVRKIKTTERILALFRTQKRSASISELRSNGERWRAVAKTFSDDKKSPLANMRKRIDVAVYRQINGINHVRALIEVKRDFSLPAIVNDVQKLVEIRSTFKELDSGALSDCVYVSAYLLRGEGQSVEETLCSAHEKFEALKRELVARIPPDMTWLVASHEHAIHREGDERGDVVESFGPEEEPELIRRGNSYVPVVIAFGEHLDTVACNLEQIISR